jgi:hypothetical protein
LEAVAPLTVKAVPWHIVALGPAFASGALVMLNVIELVTLLQGVLALA